MKKILTLLLLAAFSFASVSCDDYLDVNNNEDAPDYIKAPLYLSGIQTMLNSIYYDARALNHLSQMMGGGTYTNFANHYYSANSDQASEMFKTTYWYHGMNLENMMNQAKEDGCYPLVGIGLAIKAYSWDFITKMHGDLPMKEAFIPGLLSHNYDYQPEIFTQIRAWANEALEYLAMPDESGYMNEVEKADLIYAGDIAKWTKFAHGVIVRNLAALTKKSDFKEKYAQELLQHAALALQSTSDDAAMAMPGGGGEAQFSSYNCCWGPYLGNGTDGFCPSDLAVRIMTGTLPVYDEATGNIVQAEATVPVFDKDGNPVIDKNTGKQELDIDDRFPYELASVQYVTDTSDAVGHFDPRVTAKIGTLDANNYKNMSNKDSIKAWMYYAGSWTGYTGPIHQSCNLWGSRAGNSGSSRDGHGRWLYRNDAPYIIMTSADIQFCVAETQWILGDKAAALAAMQKGVALDLEFTAKYLVPGKPKVSKDKDGNDVYAAYGAVPGGDVIEVATFKELANEYQAGPYVDGLTVDQLTLSHIMMQKFVALFPYGANEVWVDMRKYHYDIAYTGDYPSYGNGWDESSLTQKWDSDPTKVYKGLFLKPAQVQNRKGTYNIDNNGSPCYRIRPRYNSEYMWNKKSLDALKPISGLAKNYHCSIPWFAYPGEIPM